MLNWFKTKLRHYITKKRFSNAIVYHGAEITVDSYLGNNTVIFKNTKIINSKVSENTYIQNNSVINNTEIGKYCSIAGNVYIGGAEHPMNFVSTSPVFYDNEQPLPEFFVTGKRYKKKPAKTIIESDVWIGHCVVIKSGVNVGVGAVIGAGAVVVKDVEPYSIVVGVPAKHVKWRFSESIRTELINSKWWELSKNILLTLENEFESPELFLQKINLMKNEDRSKF